MLKNVLIIFGILLASFFFALACGEVWIAPWAVWNGDRMTVTILSLRAIRVAAAFLVGGALAAAGTAYQAVLRNPLAEPYILGISSGAGLGAALAIAAGITAVLGAAALPGAAFAGAMLTLTLILLIALRGGRVDPLRLLLSGVIVGTVCSGILMFVVSCLSAAENQGLLWWLLGSLQTPDPAILSITAIAVPLGTLLLWYLGDAADILTLGEEMAHSFGVSPRRTLLLLLGTASLMTALAVALAGIIGFVGLLVPHCLRLLFGAAHRRLFILSLLAGGLFLINCDTLARSIFSAREIPVGVVTSFVGGPLFIWLLVRRKKDIEV